MGDASVGSASVLCSGAVMLTWMEWVGSRDTCRARWISEGIDDMPSLPLSRTFVMRSKSEGAISNSFPSGNIARRRSRVDI
jgi:hypothetical protein